MKSILSAVAALALLATLMVSANAATFPAFAGQLLASDVADRTVVIDSSTRYVNVTQGEKLKFLINGQEFVVDFNGVAQNIDLRSLAPNGVLDHEVEVYISVNPDTMSAN